LTSRGLSGANKHLLATLGPTARGVDDALVTSAHFGERQRKAVAGLPRNLLQLTHGGIPLARIF
jgi:aromatic ring-opening dioxygenase catalytic subunit (LigB family)